MTAKWITMAIQGLSVHQSDDLARPYAAKDVLHFFELVGADFILSVSTLGRPDRGKGWCHHFHQEY